MSIALHAAYQWEKRTDAVVVLFLLGGDSLVLVLNIYVMASLYARSLILSIQSTAV